MRILLFFEVTLFKYNVSTILSPIVACSEGIFLGGEHALSILREFFCVESPSWIINDEGDWGSALPVFC